MTHQLGTLGHVSNFFATEPQVELAESLLALLGAGPGKVFFANSGAEANEAALKLTRRTGRTHLVATEGAFHGRTMGALALTSKAAYREPFEPLPGDVTFVPYGDVDALAAAVTDETAAVVLEPIQGEAGVVVPPPGYLAAARRITREHGALLWVDEIQTGIGRTGTWFAHQNPPSTRRTPTSRWCPTWSPWPRAWAAASRSAPASPSARPATCSAPATTAPPSAATPSRPPPRWPCSTRSRPRACSTTPPRSASGSRTGLAADPRVTEVRGAGLFIGLDLAAAKSAEVTAAAQAAGFIVNNPTPERIRLRRRWCSPTRTPTPSSPPGRASSTRGRDWIA